MNIKKNPPDQVSSSGQFLFSRNPNVPSSIASPMRSEFDMHVAWKSNDGISRADRAANLAESLLPCLVRTGQDVAFEDAWGGMALY
jgi:hypothetical protein